MNPASAVILKMSESKAWERRISGWKTTRRVVERFMPGEELDDAVAAARILNERGMTTSLNPVGEHVHSEAEATAALTRPLPPSERRSYAISAQHQRRS